MYICSDAIWKRMMTVMPCENVWMLQCSNMVSNAPVKSNARIVSKSRHNQTNKGEKQCCNVPTQLNLPITMKIIVMDPKQQPGYGQVTIWRCFAEIRPENPLLAIGRQQQCLSFSQILFGSSSWFEETVFRLENKIKFCPRVVQLPFLVELGFWLLIFSWVGCPCFLSGE